MEFRERFGVGPGTLDPEDMPFYLLLVGGPDIIPFEFQYQLAVSHAVGRISFEHPEDYARYAESVVAAENQECLPSRAAFVAAQSDDYTTRIVMTEFVEPLVSTLRSRFPDFTIELLKGQDATKASLLRMIDSDLENSLLCISAHSLHLGAGHERQRELQGALICQDWPGPESGRPRTERDILAAADIPSSANVRGSLVFLLSGNTAGTPKIDDFPRGPTSESEPGVLAPVPFINRLAQRLLGHERGGALAVVGHVDQAWTLSFKWDRGVRETTFRDVFERLFLGFPLGWAMRPLVHRYIELTTRLSELLYPQQADQETPSRELISRLWKGQRDARNYIVLGDPAVRLCIDRQ